MKSPKSGGLILIGCAAVVDLVVVHREYYNRAQRLCLAIGITDQGDAGGLGGTV